MGGGRRQALPRPGFLLTRRNPEGPRSAARGQAGCCLGSTCPDGRGPAPSPHRRQPRGPRARAGSPCPARPIGVRPGRRPVHGPHARTAGRARPPLLSPHPRASSPLLGVGDEARGSAQVAGCSLCSRDGGTAGGVWVQSVSDPRATDCAQTTAEAARHTHEAARPKTEQRPLQTGAHGDRAGTGVPCALLSPPQTRSREDSARPSVETCLVARESPCRPPWGPCDRHPRTVDETAATPRAGTKAAPTEVRPGPQHAVTGAGHAGGSTCTAARDKDRFAGGGAQTQLLGPFK